MTKQYRVANARRFAQAGVIVRDWEKLPQKRYTPLYLQTRLKAVGEWRTRRCLERMAFLRARSQSIVGSTTCRSAIQASLS